MSPDSNVSASIDPAVLAYLCECVPCEAVLIGMARQDSLGFGNPQISSAGLSTRYLESLRRSDGGLDFPLLDAWRVHGQPIVRTQADPSSLPLRMFFGKELFARSYAIDAFMNEGQRLFVWLTLFNLSDSNGSVYVRELPTAVRYIEVNAARFALAPPPAPERWALLCNRKERLTTRELEIARWVSIGKSNWEIAQILGISKNTVRNAVSVILRKTDCLNRTQLCRKIVGAGAFAHLAGAAACGPSMSQPSP